MPGWGTHCFDLGRREVREFLIASALFWLEQYHIDGLRVDAVSSMLYRDYGRAPGQWRAGENGSNINEDGVSFLRELNQAVEETWPDVLMIAEESSAWDGVTKAVSLGGLGFSMKWNMGWANDCFAYLEKDPLFRRYHHEKLTFAMCYAFSEHHLLPISHDEVVYGKRSLFSKMWGDQRLKVATFRAFYAYFMTFPGKKLLFMGTEFGQENEWNWESFVEYRLLSDPSHRHLHEYVAAMNRFYLQTPALWECDNDWNGFSWILPDEADRNLLAYFRNDKHGKTLLCVICFAGFGEQRVTLPIGGRYRVVFSATESPIGLGGSGMGYELNGESGQIQIALEAPFAILAEKQK
jgi:1,4-alpha-glucan branching enzyme